MRSKIWIGLVVLGLASAVWGMRPAGAQAIDANACQQACSEAHDECAEACSEHDNPVECDGRCREALEDCLRTCE